MKYTGVFYISGNIQENIYWTFFVLDVNTSVKKTGRAGASYLFGGDELFIYQPLSFPGLLNKVRKPSWKKVITPLFKLAGFFLWRLPLSHLPRFSSVYPRPRCIWMRQISERRDLFVSFLQWGITVLDPRGKNKM